MPQHQLRILIQPGITLNYTMGNTYSISESPTNKEKVLVGFERTICYNEPEIQDSTETGTADRIWLNLNLLRKKRIK